ncbi:flavoprotein [Mycena latifolia]|nr:flavoprotein [Mycena latifolia]
MMSLGWICHSNRSCFATTMSTSTSFVSEAERTPGYTHVLLITTGSVASVKAPLIVEELLRYENVKVEVVATIPSLVFYDADAIRRAGVRVWTDEDEWPAAYKIGDPILHIELRRWADIVLVAPCSANTLSKIAHGICDNLTTSLMRALAPTMPTYIFPAMNTLMYEHPLTAEHLRIVRDVVKYTVMGPIGKLLACGDIGIGAMTEWRDIVQVVVDKFKLTREAEVAAEIRISNVRVVP